MKSAGSVQSMASVGIGHSEVGALKVLKEVQARPMPEGVLASNNPVYDCIVYLIFCPAHENIAVTSRSKSKCIWLPFVALPDGETWIKASHHGVDVLIGRNDPEMDAEVAERQAPTYRMNYLHVMRLQLPSRKTVLRLSQFIYLEANQFFHCCRDTDRVSWLSVADVQQNRVSGLWGPEVRILTTMVTKMQRQVVNEFTLSNALYYLNLGGSKQQEVLKAVKLMENHVLEIYSDYIEHCYPAFYMALESFRIYLKRFGSSFDDKTLERLFSAFRLTEEGRSFLDFHELLIGLAAFDPDCPNHLELRQRFIFKYYDTEKKGRLDVNNVVHLLTDAFPSWTPSKVQDEARLVMTNRLQLFFEDFASCFRERLTSAGPMREHLCRASISILQQISSLLASKKKERLKKKHACRGMLKAKRATKGTCWSCRAQQYEYGNHCVTIDTVGRAVEPTIIPVAPPPTSEFSVSRSHYSLEYIFSIASLPNIFIDLIRDFYAKKRAASQQPQHPNQQPLPLGLMTVPQEWYIFYKYLRILCNDLSSMLSNEKKLNKLNAPAVVVGDLRGSLHDLLHLEALFWQSFPVISKSLVFLGNYSGKAGFSIECLIYLFALKLCSPNKVYLLRGAAELSLSTSSVLVSECTRKFGTENGKLVAGVFMEIFAKLPIAVLIDENILCAHSGIPAAPRLEQELLKLPVEMANLQYDSPLAYGIVTRYPKDDEQARPRSRSPRSFPTPKNVKSARSKSKVGLCQKLFGGKVGDQRFHQYFKSISNKKSLKSMKIKSAKMKSLRLGKSPKSVNSVKTIKSGKLVKVKITKTSRAPSFHRHKKSIRKSASRLKSKSAQRQTGKKVFKNPHQRGVSLARGRNIYDKNEFLDFMKVNNLSYLIRSASVCKQGFKIKFSRQCLTVFSCSNFYRNNEGAVALIDSTALSIRFIRYRSTATPSAPPAPANQSPT